MSDRARPIHPKRCLNDCSRFMASSVGGGSQWQSHRFEAEACLWGRECLKIGGQDGAEVTLVGRLRFAKPLQIGLPQKGMALPPDLWHTYLNNGMSFILEVSQDASAVVFSVSPRLVSRSSVGSGVGALPVALGTDARLPRGVVRLSGAGGGPLCPWAGRCPSLSSAKARQATPAVCPYCGILLA